MSISDIVTTDGGVFRREHGGSLELRVYRGVVEHSGVQVGDLLAWISAELSKIPEPLRPSAYVETQCWESIGSNEMSMYWLRPETDEERQEREESDRECRERQERQEREHFERLKQKFEPTK